MSVELYYCDFASETYTTPKLMRAQTAILFLSDSVRFHTTAMGSSVQTTSAKTETAVQECQRCVAERV